MRCIHCGKEIAGHAAVCTFCGKAIDGSLPSWLETVDPVGAARRAAGNDDAPLVAPADELPPEDGRTASPRASGSKKPRRATPPAAEPVAGPTVVRKLGLDDLPDDTRVLPRKRSGLVIPILIVVALLLAAAALLALRFSYGKRYEAAAKRFAAGDYIGAADAFDTLGGYGDAEAQAALSRQSASFAEARALSDAFHRENYEQAEQIFLSLGDFAGAAEEAARCRNHLDYDAADALEREGRGEEAEAAFAALGDFDDAAARARRCADARDYQAAVALIDKGDYASAMEKLASPVESGYPDAKEQSALCGSKLGYAAAQSAYDDGKFYDAYQRFMALGDFEDAVQCAKNCVQPEPALGVLYRAKDCPSTGVRLTVKNRDAMAACYVLKTASGNLACTFFIPAGKKLSLLVPAGSYTLDAVSGLRWFGPDGMYGENATVRTLRLGQDSPFTLLRNETYTLS